MKVLLIGNGAREHAIAESLVRDGDVELFVFAKANNPGILPVSSAYEIGSFTDFGALSAFACKVKPDFAFIGPDDPIADGVADLLLEDGIHSVAPLKTVARLESSKSFTRDLVKKYGIPGNPDFKVFTTDAGMVEFLENLEGNFVVKADGLMGGKGVLVSGEHIHTNEEALNWSKKCIEKFGRVVIEEKLVGQEFSLMSFVDGTHVIDMVPIQDHKRAFEGDTGPNTGGMGSYSDSNHSLPFLVKKDLEEAHDITVQVASALFKETGVLFKGIMYGGFMVTSKGVRLIEYNARFGDPEAMNALPILQTNFVHVCRAILEGSLDKLKIEFEKKATVCKYIVPEGYPDNSRKNERIEIDMGKISLLNEGSTKLKLYYSSVDKKDDGIFTSSSRAIAVTGIADSITDAEKAAESACEAISGHVFHRHDVGTQELIQKRVDMMKRLRG